LESSVLNKFELDDTVVKRNVIVFPLLSYLPVLVLLYIFPFLWPLKVMKTKNRWVCDVVQSIDMVVYMYGILQREVTFSILELALLAGNKICLSLNSVIPRSSQICF